MVDLPPNGATSSLGEDHLQQGEGFSAVDVPHAHQRGEDGGPSAAVRSELETKLWESNGQIALVAQCIRDGISDPREIVAAKAAANLGAVSNLLAQVRAITQGDIPMSPSVARLSLSATRSFLRQHRTEFSSEALAYLNDLVVRLADSASSRPAQEREEAEIEDKGTVLEKSLAELGGVYVYTFPHYWRYPTVEGTNRTLLKVGMTSRAAAVRVREQARLTGVPEDPLLLRVYQHPDRDPRDIERDFHNLLDAADHSRSGSKTGGKEWFETSTEFLDAIASVLGLIVTSAEDDA
jgi:hypothetical protein